jgi:hypothetical protein
MLLSKDMNGNKPVRLWYMMPLFLSANAPIHKNIGDQFVIIRCNEVGLKMGPVGKARVHQDSILKR